MPPSFGLSAISSQVRPHRAIPWTMITLSLRQSLLGANLSVCGSQVHSSLAQISAHTFPDSLNSALSCTSPVLSLCPYSIHQNINPVLYFVNSVTAIQAVETQDILVNLGFGQGVKSRSRIKRGGREPQESTASWTSLNDA